MMFTSSLIADWELPRSRPRLLQAVRGVFVWCLLIGYTATACGLPGLWIASKPNSGCQCAPSLRLSGKCCCSALAAARSCCSTPKPAARSCCASKGLAKSKSGPAAPSCSTTRSQEPTITCRCKISPETAPVVVLIPTVLPRSIDAPPALEGSASMISRLSLLQPQFAPAPDGPPPRLG